MARLGRFLLRLFGWRFDWNIDPDVTKFVLIAAPHTSNIDFFVALPCLWQMPVKGRYLIKRELFWWPLSVFLRASGGIPVDRKKGTAEFVERLKGMLLKEQNFALLFTPEGTRSYVDQWKTGFHRIALETGVPIVVATADYKKRIVEVSTLFQPTADLHADLEKLEELYRGVIGKFPNQFNAEFYVRAESDV